MATRRRIALLALFALLAPPMLSGCGVGAGEAPTGVELAVTEGSGARVTLDARTPRVEGSDTVLRLLGRATKVETKYGGAFVDRIGGRGPRGAGGWFFWVDGVAAGRGAASWRLADGDRVWWDLRGDGGVAEPPAVVGSFPAPLVGGYDGRSPSVWTRCADPAGEACRLVRARLASVGARTASPAEQRLAPADSRAPVQVVVAQLERAGELTDDARVLGAGPQRSGVPYRAGDSGDFGETLDARGRPTHRLGRGEGLIAAVRRPPHPPVWIVAGTDERGTLRAAAALTERDLRLRVAVRVDGSGVRPLPERAG